MELKEVKKLVAYARKQGIKSFTTPELSVTFQDAVVFPQTGKRKPKLVEEPARGTVPAPDPLPNLDDFNHYIYGQGDAG